MDGVPESTQAQTLHPFFFSSGEQYTTKGPVNDVALMQKNNNNVFILHEPDPSSATDNGRSRGQRPPGHLHARQRVSKTPHRTPEQRRTRRSLNLKNAEAKNNLL